MALIAPPPPAEVADVMRGALRRLARSRGSLVPAEGLEIARGLALHAATGSMHGGDAPIGWRFVVTHRGGAFWLDVSAVSEVSAFEGPAVADMVRAGAVLEAAGLDGEVALLVSPLVGGGALWVRGVRAGCVRFSPESGGGVEDVGSLVAEWRARASDLARATAGLIE